MNFYERKILPKVIHCVCGLKPMMRQRNKVVPDASGVVLELGIGSGLNLPYYDSNKVTHLIGIDPTPNHKALDNALEKTQLSTEMIFESAEALPMEDDSIDSIVCTYTLCTIPDIDQTLEQCRRVLKSNGKFIFVEHGIAPDKKVQRTQNRINPIWKKLAGGCNLNRDIPQTLEQHGYNITKLESMYLPGWKPACWNVWGSAQIK